MRKPKIAMLTAGGLAPCLSSAVGGLIERYTDLAPEAEIIGYLTGYKGLLKGQSIAVTPEVRNNAHVLHGHGGSPLGNSRVKLTNVADCVKRGLVKEGQDPLAVAAERLTSDGITILHTIGGDDTNTTAAELAAYLSRNGYGLTVVGLPKTIDNDVMPIRQSLGAYTAAEQGAIFFANVVNEQSCSSRMLVIHEVMGRNCGWLTAATARAWRERLSKLAFLPEFNLSRRHKDIDAVYVPEMAIDIAAETKRLKRVMDEKDSVNIFVSEGACVGEIVKEMEAQGETRSARRLRPYQTRLDQGGRLVRQAVRQATRRRQDAGAEIRLFRSLGRRQCARPGADPHHGEPRRRLRPQRHLWRHRSRRRARWRTAGHRILPHQGRQAFRHRYAVVRRDARSDRPARPLDLHSLGAAADAGDAGAGHLDEAERDHQRDELLDLVGLAGDLEDEAVGAGIDDPGAEGFGET